ncbi:hypothetical protein NET03_04820 [Thermomicrobium sp. CFH 73360]|nr:hypothetical protein [Thermomicrobium sp. CFH 73360]
MTNAGFTIESGRQRPGKIRRAALGGSPAVCRQAATKSIPLAAAVCPGMPGEAPTHAAGQHDRVPQRLVPARSLRQTAVQRRIPIRYFH